MNGTDNTVGDVADEPSRLTAAKLKPIVGCGLLAYLVLALGGPGGDVGIALKVTVLSAVLALAVLWVALSVRERRRKTQNDAVVPLRNAPRSEKR